MVEYGSVNMTRSSRDKSALYLHWLQNHIENTCFNQKLRSQVYYSNVQYRKHQMVGALDPTTG